MHLITSRLATWAAFKYQSELESLERRLRPVGGFQGIKQTLAWPLKQDEVKNTLLNIGRLEEALTLALTADQTIAGCGKTILCSTIVENVKAHCLDHPNYAVGYFYFDFHDAKRQSTDSLIRSLIVQLSLQVSSIPQTLKDLYSRSQDSQQEPKKDEMLEALFELSGKFQQTYFIIDAIDECVEREEFFLFLEELLKSKRKTSHILTTRRTEMDI
ncbi:hypothetical protein G7Y89_g9057 [Cudoniella acicularis]|uniref:Nephrocystin 3-like N-terminal domain-containing protein n=1 Tax=Cudoniella acicularis TaxID=354080 RepID=A0A8H4RHK6_9HELO|nr:hypothetical protein G7Y89_g9057 [Cudoniella acicularis]